MTKAKDLLAPSATPASITTAQIDSALAEAAALAEKLPGGSAARKGKGKGKSDAPPIDPDTYPTGTEARLAFDELRGLFSRRATSRLDDMAAIARKLANSPRATFRLNIGKKDRPHWIVKNGEQALAMLERVTIRETAS